jgi:hypothetical protein
VTFLSCRTALQLLLNAYCTTGSAYLFRYLAMQFPFTFQFSVPGLFNPFATRPAASEPCSDKVPQSFVRDVKLHRRLPPPPPNPLSTGPPLSRKRGWVPSLSEPSQSTISLSSYSASGYFDTPAKYKDMAARSVRNSGRNEREHDDIAMEAGGFLLFHFLSLMRFHAWLSSCLWCARHTRCTCFPRSTRYIKTSVPLLSHISTIPLRAPAFRFLDLYSHSFLGFCTVDTMFIFLCIHIELPPAKRRRGASHIHILHLSQPSE